jgi:dTDP-4-amino-4,6-dideoxygalactose transaminase
MGIGHGDEVIVPSNTYIATLLAVSETSAKLVPVEPDIATYNIDPQLIESAISERTRAIVPVHLYGQPAAKSAIVDLGNRHGLQILEYGAQSHGARYRGKPIGNHGDTVAWSFYPGKNLSALGDGGAVTMADEELAANLKILRNYGSEKKYHNLVKGYNSRLDEMQAAIDGSEQLTG